MFEAEVFKLFLLVLSRFAGLIVSAPVLGSGNFPVMAKVGLAALSAMIVTPLLPALADPIPEGDLAFAILALGESAIGLAMGFVLTVIFSAIQLGGQIIDMQSGFGMMNVFNPAAETQFPIYGFFLFIVGMLYLVITGGHRLMIWGLVDSYAQIPVGGLVLRPALMFEAARWGSLMFVDGLMIAAPVAAAMFLAYATMGLVGRLVPQIHLFVVGFPLTIASSLFLVAAMLGMYVRMLDGMFARMFRNMETLVNGMS